MRRTTWTAVGIVAVLLLASSGLSRTTWHRWSAIPARVSATFSALDWASITPESVRAAAASLSGLPWVWILNGVVCLGAIIAAAVTMRPKHGDPRRTVRRLARGGGTLAVIARRSHLSQDAVRTLLTENNRRRVPTPCLVEPARATDPARAAAPARAADPARAAEPSPVEGRKILPFGKTLRKELAEERPRLVEGLSLVR